IHGWFVQPRPFVEGPLPGRALTARTSELAAVVGDFPVAGLLSLAFTVDRRGAVRRLRILSDTTRVAASDEPAQRKLIKNLEQTVAAWKFGSQRASSEVTLPIVFERG